MTMANIYWVKAQTAYHTGAGESTTARLRKFIRDYADSHHFNGWIRVEEDGKPLFNGSFGIADRTFHVPCTDATKYKIASIAEAFTAVRVLQLVEEMKIGLDQPIKQYLSSYGGEGVDRVKV